MTQQSSGAPSAASIGRLIASLAEQSARLVRAEIDLTKAELTGRVKELGTGVGLFGAAGLVALYGLGALVATAIIALALVLPAWAAALVVTGALFLVAGVLALVGKAKVAKGTPATPTAALASVKADIETVRKRIKP